MKFKSFFKKNVTTVGLLGLYKSKIVIDTQLICFPCILLLDQGCFWFRGALILLVSRRRWSIQPLLTVSKKPSPVSKKSSRLTARTKSSKPTLKVFWDKLQELDFFPSKQTLLILVKKLCIPIQTSKTSFNNDQQGKIVLSKTGLN